MKKNKMLRMASALLVLTLLTTSIIGGTFAKYTTASTGTDTARVAKWGVTINMDSDLFKAEYNGTETGYEAKATVKTTETDKKLVAPGTTGTGLNVSSTGTKPEVSYNMTITLNGTTAKIPSLEYKLEGETGSKSYDPVKFSVYYGTTPLAQNKTLGELIDLLNNKIVYMYDVNDDKYYVDKNLDGTIADNEKTDATNTAPNIKITWKWDFETGADAEKPLNNALDTILGDNAAGSNVPAEITVDSKKYSITADSVDINVNLDWTVTATQID